MKVVHVIPYMHPSAGGPPVVVDRFARLQAQRGWDVEVLTTNALAPTDDNSWQAEYGQGYRLRVFRSRGRHAFGFSGELRQAIRSAAARVDLVHLHNLWSYASLVTIPICRRAGVPVVVNPHGMLDPHSLERKSWKKSLYGRAIEFPRLRQASAMIFTHATEEMLAGEACSGLPSGHVVPLGCDEPPAASLAAQRARFISKFPELEGRHVAMFLSRLHEKKGLDLLLPAFSRVVRGDSRAHLAIAGPGEPSYVASLRRRVQELGLSARVTLCGPQMGDWKWNALAAADVVVLPSYQENFAIVVVEAMRQQRPVLVSRRVNLWPEVVDAGAGRVCELSEESIAQELLALLRDEGARLEAGRIGERLAHERFTWPAAEARLEQVYRQVLGKAQERAA